MSERSEEHIKLIIELKQLDILADQLKTSLHVLARRTVQIRDVIGSSIVIRNIESELAVLDDIRCKLLTLSAKVTS